ncbi:uncharacterized protein HMPREF1541_01991 [Cyphellophora europaea CBS 101466]|uniref:Multicopper oxidase n=1 Tax=Cyphellophora europaea (strain CBS 101466) TaxID=1220924 RepID=W2S451_CYPE1|nr:uncharacterized protein HMPREF1541_01991 [Cyphellophora europaea CBS 101466]ETN42833.1 hypothetical protein HMPREF1541_01991 [Cyphellophora europaea CBS 101466]
MVGVTAQLVLAILSLTSIVSATDDWENTYNNAPAEHDWPSVEDVLFPPDFQSNPINPGNIDWTKDWLSQEDTNGASLLGTLDAPKYRPYMDAESYGSALAKSKSKSGSKAAVAYPWGGRTAKLNDPYHDLPVTNQTRSYHFVIERGIKSPDGVQRHVMLINGEFPGPTIVADWGDRINVTVENRISDPEEGLALHWHGILHRGSPWEDGVPGITQHPIATGETFTYSFIADLYGTTWYHSHYSAQYADGVFGAMIIHGPSHVDYDEDLGPVLLSDTYHRDYFDLLEDIMGNDLNKTKEALFSSNNLIQGKGTYDCSLTTLPCYRNGGYAKFHFDSGKSYRLRLINSGADTIQHFSIDDHTLTVIANDMVPVVPYDTDVVVLGIGQRTDVVVTANSQLGAVWMRSNITACSLAKQPNGLAVIYYDDCDTTIEPTSPAWPPRPDLCANDDLSLTVPYYPIPVPATPDKTITIEVNSTINATGNLVWTMNESSFRVNYNDPALYRAHANDPGFVYPPEWNLYNLESSESVRLVVINHSPIGHPMHLHGHNMYVLHEGKGYWDESSIIRPENPQRRDTQMLRPADPKAGTPSHIVIQIDSDNPGVWPFHCHIAWHVSGGLYVNLLERPADIPTLNIPQDVLNLQTAWDQFTGEGPINQIDSGL